MQNCHSSCCKAGKILCQNQSVRFSSRWMSGVGGSRLSPAATPFLGTGMLIKIFSKSIVLRPLPCTPASADTRRACQAGSVSPGRWCPDRPGTPTGCYLVGNGQVVNPQMWKTEGQHTG